MHKLVIIPITPRKEVRAVENIKRGRPKTNKPTRDKSINIRLTENELKTLQEICYEHRIAYVDVLKKGLEFWSPKK